MDEPSLYEIRVAEQITERWTTWLDGLEIIHSHEPDETILRGEMADQPALFGVLGKIRDLGLTLISVQRLSPRQSDSSPTKETNSDPKVK
jgi:hypothetical protein